MKYFSKGLLLIAVILGVTNILTAADQPKDAEVLFTFGDSKVYTSEFLYVYEKNNVNDADKFSKQSLEEYLELYINFRLKVKEAESLGYDTIKAINDELGTYREQLAQSYLSDKEVNEKLLKEAYERMKQEVRASHILIKVEDPGMPADTLAAYKKAMGIREQLLRGANFVELAKKYSSDPSVKENGGDIGYFTVLQTVYPFETAAYNTEIGSASKPVRTRFGYHILKVTDKRQARGKLKVAHILVKVGRDAKPEQEQQAKDKLDKVMQRLEDGEPFDVVAKLLSEDNLTGKNGGELPEAGPGKWVPEFEEAAYSIKEVGGISEPVRTDYGWHVIKLLNRREIESYDEIKHELKKRVERDARSSEAVHVLVKRIKKEYGFTEYTKNLNVLFDKLKSRLEGGRFSLQDKHKLTKTIFKIGDQSYKQVDFVKFIEDKHMKPRRQATYQVFTDYYNRFVEESCLEYEKGKLEDKYPEFKALMQEYHDGVLLFELTDEKVWSKAIKDTLGLQLFHRKNRNDYMWDTRAEATIYQVADPKVAKRVRKQVNKGKLTNEELLEKYNSEENPGMITFESDVYEKGENDIVDQFSWTVGVSDVKEKENELNVFVNFDKILDPEPKSLDEAKGFIVSDYQEYLEGKWIDELREKYPVKVNEEIFNALIK